MKIEKLVRITAKSECMDIEVVMTSKKATAYVKKLSKIQEEWIKSISEKTEVKYRPKSYWGPVKTRTVRVVPEGTNQKISIKIEPAGEILN
jgi:hypothetical protein